MLVAWRYRKREKSFIQWFDPRAWITFYLCYLFSALGFWDVRFLLPFFVVALIVLFTSGVKLYEIRRALLFIVGFVFFFAILTSLQVVVAWKFIRKNTSSDNSKLHFQSLAGLQL
jgi:energy-coupling factor transport system permease protein